MSKEVEALSPAVLRNCLSFFAEAEAHCFDIVSIRKLPLAKYSHMSLD